MIGKCVRNALKDLTDSDLNAASRRVHLSEVDLTIGQEYLIFGVSFQDDHLWFLVCEEEGDKYPKPHFGPFFDLLDNRIPPDWSLCLTAGNAGPVALLPNPWARDPSFLEKLVNEAPEALALFSNIKQALTSWHSR